MGPEKCGLCLQMFCFTELRAFHPKSDLMQFQQDHAHHDECNITRQIEAVKLSPAS